ncbi:MAG: sigma 54-interacting transcriptional regulator [Candidatus Anammoxibacter sp.]
MLFNAIVDDTKKIKSQEIRFDLPHYFESIIYKDSYDRLRSIFENRFGAPLERSIWSDRLATPLGGVRPGQTIFYAERETESCCAVQWPWVNGECVTVKVLCKPVEETGQLLNMPVERLTNMDAHQLVHGQKIYMSELAMQNDVLCEEQKHITELWKKYLYLFSSSPVGIFVHDKNGNIKDVNKRVCKMFRKEEKTLVNTSFFESIVSEDRDVLSHYLQNIFNRHMKDSCILNLKSNDRLFVQLESWDITESDRCGLCVTTITDITGKKLAEEKLEQKTKIIKGMVKISTFLINVNTEEELYEKIPQIISDSFGFDGVSFGVCQENSGKIICRGCNETGKHINRYSKHDAEASVSGSVIKNNEHIRMSVLNKVLYECKTYKSLGYKHVSCYPLKVAGGVLGTICMASKKKMNIDHHFNSILQDVVGSVAKTFERKQLIGKRAEKKIQLKFHDFVGSSKEMQKIYALIDNLSVVDSGVLILGESGTGKELLAHALHFHGKKDVKLLVKVNCAGLSDNLLESELFGHVRGAFTGAVKDRIGRFQMAEGGTIFLVEIGDISMKMQLCLLRVLQENEFERLGDSTPIKTNVRIIAATNQDLHEKVKTGTFRLDLFYRLAVVEITLPPLRDRLSDIPSLVGHFLEKFNKKFGKNIQGLNDEVDKLFVDYTWPGNVREFEHVIEHAFVVCNSNIITAEHISSRVVNYNKICPASLLTEKFAKHEEIIIAALDKSHWNKTIAARLLGIDRKTLYSRIKKYNIGDYKLSLPQ